MCRSESFIKHHRVHFRELEHSGMIRTTLTTKNYPVPNVNGGEVDKPGLALSLLLSRTLFQKKLLAENSIFLFCLFFFFPEMAFGDF